MSTRCTGTCGPSPRSSTTRRCCARRWSNRTLPADRLFALAQDQEIKDGLLAETQRAVDRGTFGSPTFFVDDEIYFGKDRLRDVEEAIAAKK